MTVPATLVEQVVELYRREKSLRERLEELEKMLLSRNLKAVEAAYSD
jgi:hypothetical protein